MPTDSHLSGSLKKNTHVIVAMSGGVDSSVVALLLKNQGYSIEGVYMQNWQEDSDDSYCTANQDMLDAKSVCGKLGINFKVVNFSHEYWQHVFQHFLDEYSNGNTPNPDVLCNREIKFGYLLDYAKQNGADFIATGHYVRKEEIDGKFCLLKAVDHTKDQSYFLYMLTQEQLKYSMFPLGDMTKTKVREIAKEAGFLNCAKKDSTGICFIGERKFKTFLSEYLLAKPGNIETLEQIALGKHSGLMFYTLGQRQGLGIGGCKHMKEAPWYVIKKDLERNVLVVSQDKNHPLLMSNTLYCKDLHWISGGGVFDVDKICYNDDVTCLSEKGFFCTAKIRYRQDDRPCFIVKCSDNLYKVEFKDPEWAITPGQSVVFYDGEICLGGGIICGNVGNNHE